MRAIADINADYQTPLELVPIERDPDSVLHAVQAALAASSEPVAQPEVPA